MESKIQEFFFVIIQGYGIPRNPKESIAPLTCGNPNPCHADIGQINSILHFTYCSRRRPGCVGYWVSLSLHGRPTWSVNLEECLSTGDSPWCCDSGEILLPRIKIGCCCLLSKHCAIIVVIGICPKENKNQTALFYLLFHSFVCLLV